MDQFTRAVLVVIALALVSIAVKMWMPGYATLGDFQALAQIADPQAKEAARAAIASRLVMVRMQGGTVAVDVTQMP